MKALNAASRRDRAPSAKVTLNLVVHEVIHEGGFILQATHAEAPSD